MKKYPKAIDKRRRVLATLQRGARNTRHIEELLGLTKGETLYALRQLREAGHIREVSKGKAHTPAVWRVTAMGSLVNTAPPARQAVAPEPLPPAEKTVKREVRIVDAPVPGALDPRAFNTRPLKALLAYMDALDEDGSLDSAEKLLAVQSWVAGALAALGEEA